MLPVAGCWDSLGCAAECASSPIARTLPASAAVERICGFASTLQARNLIAKTKTEVRRRSRLQR